MNYKIEPDKGLRACDWVDWIKDTLARGSILIEEGLRVLSVSTGKEFDPLYYLNFGIHWFPCYMCSQMAVVV